MRKKYIYGCFVSSLAAIVAFSFGGPAAALDVTANDATAGPGLPIADVSVQDEYATELEAFLVSNPAPEVVSADASVAEKNLYWKSAVEFWKSVPWEAVAGQWGCTFEAAEARFNAPDRFGVVSAGYGTIMNCGGAISDDLVGLVSRPQTKASLIAENTAMNIGEQTDVSPLFIYCDTQGSAQLCLRNGSGTISATTQWVSFTTVTGQARLGQVGLTGACAQGTQIAISPVGIGTFGAIWTASAPQLVNGRWSSSFLISGGVYGRFCDIL